MLTFKLNAKQFAENNKFWLIVAMVLVLFNIFINFEAIGDDDETDFYRYPHLEGVTHAGKREPFPELGVVQLTSGGRISGGWGEPIETDLTDDAGNYHADTETTKTMVEATETNTVRNEVGNMSVAEAIEESKKPENRNVAIEIARENVPAIQKEEPAAFISEEPKLEESKPVEVPAEAVVEEVSNTTEVFEESVEPTVIEESIPAAIGEIKVTNQNPYGEGVWKRNKKTQCVFFYCFIKFLILCK